MNKIISISILVAYLCASTEFIQLLKIPLLIEHFIEHTAASKEITFKEFFILHYLDAQHVDGDYDKDMRLPFKTVNNSITNIISSIPSLRSEFVINIDGKEGTNFISYGDLFINSTYISSIWQPPRFF
jgi:hypothetical protein